MKGKSFVVGVSDEFGKVVNTIECYDPLPDSWTVVGKTDYDVCLLLFFELKSKILIQFSTLGYAGI